MLWNVFLFVICGGSLIYGYVQQRRMVESKVEIEKCQQQVDSLKKAVDKLNADRAVALKQLSNESAGGRK
jgi:hypothetical protein